MNKDQDRTAPSPQEKGEKAAGRPWRIGASGSIHAGENGSKPIATVHQQGADFDWQSNAALIAAAPELLEALERITRYVDMAQRADKNKPFIVDCAAMQDAMNQARGAIAKAEGL
jgi:hypothetical protein